MRAPEAPKGPLPRLRGRDAHLTIVSGHLRQLRSGCGGVVLIEGPAGTGRSRLLAETVALASSMGLAAAVAAADELTAAAPLETLVEALRSGPSPVLTASEVEELASCIGRRRDLLHRLDRLLAARAGRRPLLVALDDVQWADPLTLGAVAALAREPARIRVLWVVARRTAAAGPAFGRLTGPGTARIALEPLDDQSVRALVRELAGGEPDGDLMARLEGAGGNPAYVVELLRGLAAEGRIELTGGRTTARGEHLPARLRAVVLAHLRHLSEGARHLLQAGSVLGRRFRLEQASALLSLPAAAARPLVAAVVAAGVLVQEEASLVFRQELVRLVVADGLPEALRQALHRDAGRLLLAGGAGAAAAVDHFAIGAAPGDEEAIDVLWRAARETAATAPGAGADLALRALRIVGPQDARRPELLAFAIPLLGATGRLDEVEPVAAAALADGLGAETEAAVRLGMAVGLARAGETALAGRHVRAGLERGGPTGALAAGLLATQAGLLVQGSPRRSAEVARAAVREGGASGGASAVVAGRVVLAALALHRGRLSRALTTATAAVEQADAVGRDAWVCEPRGLVAMVLTGLGRFDEALGVLERARRDGEATASPWLVGVCASRRALVHLCAGRLDEASATAATALAAAAGRRLDPVVGQAHAVLAEVAVRRGELATARAHAVRAAALPDDAWGLAHRGWPMALVAAAEGQPETAIEALDDALAGLRRRRFGVAVLDPARLPVIVRMALRTGDIGRAELVAAAARELADRNPGARDVAGAAAHASGLLDDDPATLGEAVELLRAGQRPIAVAEALEDYGGTLLRARADRAEAVAALDEAHCRFTAAGAGRDAARVRLLLRSAGARRRYASSRVRPVAGWASLTESELVTARLAAEGLTNRAIAMRLFVSPHTVGTHLRHVYAKLRVRTRAALTRIVVAHADDDGPR
ncbi:MAG TPA: AAA family ATPase [Candidatus Dormibacteraeota bacterium]|nr:AAA family ATPase [Candidatus Dormibacteraeota bacterium]